MTTKHVLKMSCGVTAEMDFNEETAQMNCQWTPAPPYSPATIEKVRAEYEPWRNEILEAWSKRTGKKTLCITV